MRCKSCEYPLWQIRARQCPECGTPFAPSEHEFTLNSVQFCCPHCGQDYYGTGDKGHLVPRTFACVKCAKFIDMDQMVLLPTAGVEEKQTEVTVVPWVNRRGRNWLSAFFGTMGMAIGNPVRLIRAVPEESPGAWAFWYGLLHFVPQLFIAGFPILFLFSMGAVMGSGRGGYMALIVAFCGVVAAAPALLGLWIGLAHLTLRVTGPVERGVGRTAHAICYSAGNNFISLIPCIATYFFWAGGLWWAITAGFMLAAGQKVRGWRAGLAVGLPLVACGALVIGGFVGFVYYMESQTSRSMAASAGVMSAGQARAVAMAMQSRMRDMSKPAMGHVAELMVDDRVMASQLLDMGSGVGWSGGSSISNKMQAVTVGGRTMMQWQSDRAATRAAAAANAAAGLPAGVTEYRVGDMVLTHSGMDVSKHTDRRLWLVVAWPEGMDRAGGLTTTSGGVTVTAPARTEVAVGRADGTAVTIDLVDFDAELADQNARRAKFGLAPLTHPADVVGEAPAGGGER